MSRRCRDSVFRAVAANEETNAKKRRVGFSQGGTEAPLYRVGM